MSGKSAGRRLYLHSSIDHDSLFDLLQGAAGEGHEVEKEQPLTHTVKIRAEGMRVDQYIAQHYQDFSRTLIRKAIDALNQGTMRLAELMMDTAVSSALKGKTMDETDLGEAPTAPHPMAKAEFE